MMISKNDQQKEWVENGWINRKTNDGDHNPMNEWGEDGNILTAIHSSIIL